MSRRGSRFGTIRTRLTFWYVLLLALTLLAFSAFVSIRLERSLLDQSDDLLRSSAFQVRGLIFPIELAVSVRRVDETDDALLRDFATQPALARVARGLRENGVLIRIVNPEGQVPASATATDEGLPAGVPAEPGFFVAVGPGGEPVRVFAIPLEIRDPDAPGEQRMLGWIQTGRPMSAWQRSILVLRAQMILGIPLTLILAGLGGLFLASRALSPIDRITRTAQAISARDLSRRIAYDGPPDEVGRLATTFDQMLDRIETGFERERRFTADASHELRTPLAVMKGRVEVALSRPRDAAEYEATLREVGREVDRLIQLSGGLLLLARLDHGEVRESVEVLDLSDLLDSMAESLGPRAQLRGLRLECVTTPGLTVRGDLDQLTRLFLNPLDNALKYTEAGGAVGLRATRDGAEAVVLVRDSGPGIAPEHLPHIFERFYRASSARSRSGDEPGGTGLGLAIAEEIARHHGGSISVASEPGRGTSVTIRLPLTAPSGQPEPALAP